MLIGIYKITSPVKKVYVGQSKNIEKRFKRYVSCCQRQRLLRNSFKEYGCTNHSFEIIELCEASNLDKRERYWQEYYDVLGANGLNCSLQRCEGKKGKMRKESILRNSLANKGRVSNRKGIKTGKSSAISKVVLNLETGIFYDSIIKASKSLNMKSRTLNAMLTGQNPNLTSIVYV